MIEEVERELGRELIERERRSCGKRVIKGKERRRERERIERESACVYCRFVK